MNKLKGSITEVERKKDNKYRAQIDLPRTKQEKRKQKVKIFETEEEATTWLAKMNHKIFGEGYVEQSETALKNYLTDSWLPARKNQDSPSTLRRREQIVNNRIIPELGNVKLKNLTAVRIEEFLDYMKREGRVRGDEPLSDTTVHHYYKVLHKALNDAVEKQLIDFNPAKGVNPPQPDNSEMEFLTPTETATFIKTVENNEKHSAFRRIFQMAPKTGFRKQELFGLQWNDIDFDNGIISIVRTRTQTCTNEIVVGNTKNESSRRTFSMPPQMRKQLQKYKNYQNKRRLEYGRSWKNDSNWVFTNDDGTPVNPNTLKDHFKDRLSEANLRNIRFHDLRHTFAVLMLKDGEHPKVVADAMGHKDVKQFLNRYSHVIPSMHKEATENLEQRLLAEVQDA